eukprot:scaffold2402_cov74-Phaeocystis_antarctica.AAC.2
MLERVCVVEWGDVCMCKIWERRGGQGTVAQRGLRVSRGKACGVWRAFRIARLNRGRTRATRECGGTGAVGQRRSAGAYTWSYRSPVGTVGSYRHCDVQCLVFRGEHAGRAREIVETGGCVSSKNHPRLAALHSIISAGQLPHSSLLCTDVHPTKNLTCRSQIPWPCCRRRLQLYCRRSQACV